MANSKTSNSQSPNSPKKLATREGLRRTSGDVVGFRDLETQGPLYGIPRAAKLSDSTQDESKPSIFVVFEALEEMEVTEGSGDDAVTVKAQVGDMVGLWLKGGMRPIRGMCGLKVLIQHTGEKKLKGRPASQSPMKTYQFDTDMSPANRGGLIPVIEDNRKISRNVLTMLDATGPRREREPGEDDDVGF